MHDFQFDAAGDKRLSSSLNAVQSSKTIITQIGGNDLDRADTSVEQITSDYAVQFTEVKDKFPENNIIIPGSLSVSRMILSGIKLLYQSRNGKMKMKYNKFRMILALNSFKFLNFCFLCSKHAVFILFSHY